MRKFQLIGAVAVALVLMIALLAALAPATPAAAQNTKCYMERGGTRWICGDGGTMLFQSGSTLTMASGSTLNTAGFLTTTIDELTVNGDAAITGTLEVDGDATLAGVDVEGNADVTGNLEVTSHIATSSFFYAIPPTVLTVTDGATITPDASVIELTAAGTVGAELSGCGDGQFLHLINLANQTITISETASARMAGDFAMGQYDTISFVGSGVTCFETARSNN